MNTNEAKTCTVIHYKADNDVNGNPRRLYCVYRAGALLCVLKEGYSGDRVLDEPWGKEVGEVLRQRIAHEINITPSEYKRILNEGTYTRT